MTQMEHPVNTLVRDELKHTEKTLHNKAVESERLGNQQSQLSARCIEIGDEIESHTNHIARLTAELNATRNQLTVLDGVKRDLDSQRIALETKIEGYRDFLGQR
jgi:chromosome segregation ATPase